MKDKKSFLFYLDWEVQLTELEDDEIVRFIFNLFKYHKGEEVDLQTKVDKILWNGVLPALKINQEKYEERVERNKINGQKGGRPKKNKDVSYLKEIFNKNNNPHGLTENPENLITDNRKKITENSKEIKDNKEKVTSNRKKKIENGEQIIDENKSIDELVINSLNPANKNEFSSTSNDYQFEMPEILKELNFCFTDIPDWKEKLYYLGLQRFISQTEGKHGNHPTLIAMITEYYKKNEKK